MNGFLKKIFNKQEINLEDLEKLVKNHSPNLEVEEKELFYRIQIGEGNYTPTKLGELSMEHVELYNAIQKRTNKSVDVFGIQGDNKYFITIKK